MSSIKIRSKRLNEHTQIRVLITHPMDNGSLKNKQGKLTTPHYIKELTVERNNNKIIACSMGGSVSKNPYFDFLLKGGKAHDKITIYWNDNRGITDSNTHTIK